jgi:hypothetical protein
MMLKVNSIKEKVKMHMISVRLQALANLLFANLCVFSFAASAQRR